MAINVINGTDILVYFGTADGEVKVYCTTTGTLNINSNMVGASCKDSGSWENNQEGTKSWDVSVDGLYQLDEVNGFYDISGLLADDGDTGETATENDVSIVFGQIADVSSPATGDVYWKGSARLSSCSLTAPDGENSTWSATFTGNGPCKQYKPA